MELGLLILRATVGLTIAAHGAQKLFGWFGGPGLDATGKSFEALGFYPGRRHALLASLVETGGGLLLALGAATPLGAALVASLMVVAAVTVHLPRGFFVMGGGYEYNVVLGAAALTLAFTGPGAWSVDALLGLSTGGLFWGLAATVVGALGAVFQLAQRRRRTSETGQPATT